MTRFPYDRFAKDYLEELLSPLGTVETSKDVAGEVLLGRRRVQQRAIEEVQALDVNDPLRSKAINLLANLKTTLEISQNLDVGDRNLIMQLSPIYEQRLEEARQTERRTIIENILRVRFGILDEQLTAIIEPILALPPEEFTSLLVQLSREDLLRRFNQQ